MDENKDFGTPEEEIRLEFDPVAETESLLEEVIGSEPAISPEPGNVVIPEPENVNVSEPETMSEPVPASETQPQSASGIYRGAGAGRKESPFADSPYVMHHSRSRQKPEAPVFREPEPEQAYIPAQKEKKAQKGLGRRILACAAALALVVGSCGLTALLVNSRWEQRTTQLENSFARQMEAMQQQIQALSPENTGVSVSGTVAVADGFSAGQVYAQNVQSVVLIESTIVTSMYGQTASGVSSGSGFIISEDGYVVTNYHVIEGATSVNVVLYDNTVHPADVVGYDSTNDIALLKVEASGLDAAVLGSSDDLIVGDQVVAIGNPLGELTATLTVGYVSAKERTVSTDGTVINMIQTDAAINSGNSGGPLFNMKGEVVGITTAKYSGSSSSGATIEGIGFAIPIDDVMEELEELKEFGYIKSAYLGVLVQNMDAGTANVYSLPVGAYVAGVEEGYCAARAGIQAKDIIVAVGDEKVETITDLTRILRDYEPGDKAKITVYRAGQYLTIVVVLDERPADVDAGTIITQPED